LMQWFQGKIADNTQRQINIVDNVSWQRGVHLLKFGLDYRRLSPHFGPELYNAEPAFLGTNNVLAQSLFFLQVRTSRGGTARFNNVGLFAQDTWRMTPRLTLTYGLRWDLDLPPGTTDGPPLVAVNSVDNADQIRPLPLGAPLWQTTFGNVAPRFGAAYQLSERPDWASVVRGGFGLFYDLASTEAGSALLDFAFPFGASSRINGGPGVSNLPFPLTPTDATPPQLTNTPPVPLTSVTSFDPHLQLPYTFDWNVAVEQQLGGRQSLTATYIGSVGRRLLQREFVGDDPNNPFFSQSWFLRNAATSNYNSLQLQYLRRLSRGLQVNASYTLSHSIDTGSSAALQDAQYNIFSDNSLEA
jgi:outer membrane receptor protein involved in Fe transport